MNDLALRFILFHISSIIQFEFLIMKKSRAVYTAWPFSCIPGVCSTKSAAFSRSIRFADYATRFPVLGSFGSNFAVSCEIRPSTFPSALR